MPARPVRWAGSSPDMIPQLTAIALQNQWFEGGVRQQFWRDARRFWQTADTFALRSLIQLRAHDLALADWHDVLRSRPDDLRSLPLGISLPAVQSTDLRQMAKDLTVHNIQVVHFSEHAAALPLDLAALRHAGLALSRSCHDLNGVQAAAAGHFTWAWLSPIFSTPSKPNIPAVDLEILAAAATQIPNYICALGGINAQNANLVLRAGAAGVVCHRAAWSAQCENLCRTIARAQGATVA